jgi:hypothetical protein
MKKYPVKTTTFICSSHIKPENNLLNTRHRLTPFHEARRHDVLYNLLRSHDCNWQRIRQVGGEVAEKRAKQFLNIAALRCHRFFEPHHDWWGWLNSIRLIFKWISFGDAGKVMRMLGQEYIRMERELVDILDQANTLLQNKKRQNIQFDISKKKKLEISVIREISEILLKSFRAETHLTLGSIPECLKSLLKGQKISDRSIRLIETFSKALEQGSQNRNLLMHGRIDSKQFMESTDNKSWVWESFMSNYFDVILNFNEVTAIAAELAESFVANSNYQTE